MRRTLTRLAIAALACGALAVAPAGAAARLPPIKHVFIIMLENKSYDETFGYLSAAPYLSLTLPAKGALVPNFYGVTHFSLGNYLALISGQGSNPATQLDCQTFTPVLPGTIGADGQAAGNGCVYPATVKTIADQLTGTGLSWKGYMEDMANGAGQPHTCRHPAMGAKDLTQKARLGDQYAARHNPFVYFRSLLDSGACASRDVPLDRLSGDLASAARTPSFSLITPNLCNDGHDSPCVDGRRGGLAGINGFLSTWVPRILASPAYRSGGLLAVLFDEAGGTDASACCGEPPFPNAMGTNGGVFPGPGGGRTGAVLLSPFIDPGTIDLSPANDFTTLRSLEDLFRLGHLGYAARPHLSTFGSDLYTCFTQHNPRARRGTLPRGSEIKLTVIGQGTARRPMLELKLWHPGRITVQVPAGRHGQRTLPGPRSAGACQLVKISLPGQHGILTLSARAFGGVERRTISF